MKLFPLLLLTIVLLLGSRFVAFAAHLPASKKDTAARVMNEDDSCSDDEEEGHVE